MPTLCYGLRTALSPFSVSLPSTVRSAVRTFFPRVLTSLHSRHQGAPASGKGTLCNKLIQDPHFSHVHHVSVGDLLRGMPSGPDINGHIANGTVLPGDELVPILAAHISSLSPGHIDEATQRQKVVLLDGFPRSLEQEEAARRLLASSGSDMFPDLVVYFSCAKDILRDRYIARKRGQDDGSLFEKRFEQHERECPAVLKRYKERGILVEVSAILRGILLVPDLADICRFTVAARSRRLIPCLLTSCATSWGWTRRAVETNIALHIYLYWLYLAKGQCKVIICSCPLYCRLVAVSKPTGFTHKESPLPSSKQGMQRHGEPHRLILAHSHFAPMDLATELTTGRPRPW